MRAPRRRSAHVPAPPTRRTQARRRKAPPPGALPRAQAHTPWPVRGARCSPPPYRSGTAAPAALPGGVRTAAKVSLRDPAQTNARPPRRLDAAPMSEPARIAVLIPCYRDAGLALEAVHSVQEDEPIEIAIIDDHSDVPATETVLLALEAEGVTVLRHDSNQGPAAARATGLKATSAPYVFPLDSDDLAIPGVLGRMADALDDR